MFTFWVIVSAIGVSVWILYTLFLKSNSGGASFNSSYYETHVQMVKDHCEKRAPGTFEDFLKMFESVKEWETKKDFPGSFFAYGRESKIHAWIIQFDDVGMILDEKSWVKFIEWEKKAKEEWEKKAKEEHEKKYGDKPAFEVPWRKEY